MEWRPFELHPEIPPEGTKLSAYLRAQFESTTERLKQMAAAAGLEMVFPELIPNSRRALEAAEYAREQGEHERFHTAVFNKLYAEGQDISDWEVLGVAAKEAGIDPDEMKGSTEAGTYRGVVDRHIAEAKALGVTGVPLYILNNKYGIFGAQPYEVFEKTIARLKSESEESPAQEG